MKYLLSQLYGLAVRLRNRFYLWGWLPSHQLRHPVISVGNLTVGGTGKTPLVEFLARILQQGGFQPIVLSRGYGGRSQQPVLLVSDGREVLCQPEECGDEPHLLARRLKGVPVVVAKDRFRAGQLLETHSNEKTVYLLDDGHQHLRLRRNLNLLVLDGTDPFGGCRLQPAGRLREPLSGLRRADAVLITRSHLALGLEEMVVRLRHWNKTVPLTYFYHDITNLYDLKTGEEFRVREFFGKKVIALAAIGNPQVFLKDLEIYQLKVLDQCFFRDHHPFTQAEIDRVLGRMHTLGAEAVITTEKDAVRLEKLALPEGVVYAARIEVRAEDPEVYQHEFLNEMEYLPPAR